MLFYASLAYLSLLPFGAQSVNLLLSNTEYNEPTCEDQIEKKFDYYLISPDTFDDTFLVAQCKDIVTEAPFHSRCINVTLTLHNDNSDPIPKECHIQLIIRGEDPSQWGVTSLRRLSKDRFIIAWYTKHEDGTTTDAYVLDLNKCHGWIEPLESLEELPGQPFVLPLTHTTYDMFRDQCAGRYRNNGACRVQYELSNERHLKDSMRMAYDWSTFRADKLNDERVIVRGWSTEDGAYMAHTMNRKRRMERVFEARNSRSDDQFPLVSSGMAFCWILNPRNNTRVQCQLVDDEKVIVDGTVRFKESIEIIDVRAAGENEIMMITKRKECKDERDCWSLRATRIGVREGGEKYVEHKDFAVPCMGNEQEKLVVFEARSDGVRFGCKRGLGFHFGFKRIF